MDGVKMSPEVGSASAPKAIESAPTVVFQPQKLKEVVDIIDLMGNVATRVREDNSGDTGGGTGTGKAQQKSGTSARDEAIANAPAVEVMQQKLVEHLRQEMASIEREARKISRSNDRGSAWLLSELYRKLRSLSTLMHDILHASAEVVKRFYVSVFIDRQPLAVTGDSAQSAG